MPDRPALTLAAVLLVTLIPAGCSSGPSDTAVRAAERGCEHLAEELERGDITGLLAAPIVLREAHEAVESDVSIGEFDDALRERCPQTLDDMEARIDQMGG